jgi:hypothetical protein
MVKYVVQITNRMLFARFVVTQKVFKNRVFVFTMIDIDER